MDIRIQQIKKKLNVYDEYTDYQGTYEKKTKKLWAQKQERENR